MNITELRNLIRTGEYLEHNNTDDYVRNQWLFDVEEFLDAINPKYHQRVFNAISTLRSYSTSMVRDLSRVRTQNISVITGLLRSLYNHDYSENKPVIADSQSVFIVHGHDDELIEDAKQVVQSLGLTPIVLREQPNSGMTIIEKLEQWLGNCKCAIILYTPCDLGKAKNDEQLEERARQNVVYEHGLFQGYLGRKRVILLKKDRTVVPGDCSGVVYISADSESWKEQLSSNIQAIDQ